MTHTLHRQGTRDSLAHDFAVLVRTAAGYNDTQESRDMVEVFLRLALKHNPVNIGNHAGNIHACGIDPIRDYISIKGSCNVVFACKEDLVGFLQDLQAIRFSLSVTVSGIEEIVREACSDCGITPHSVNMSLGIFGKTSKLPRPEVLQITTMCGHHQVSPYLVEDIVSKIKTEKITSREGALKVVQPCPCGVVNIKRAEQILNNLASQGRDEDVDERRIKGGSNET